MLASILLTGLLSSPLLPPPGPPPVYRAIIIDGVTRQALPAVTVQEVAQGKTYVTDAAGKVAVATAGSSVHLHLTCLGYQPVKLTRPLTGLPLDTVRLQPATTELADVVVRPRRDITLSPFGRSPHASTGYYMIPSVQVAVHLPGLPQGGTGQVSQLKLQLQPTAIRTGGLRVQLLSVPADSTAGPTGTPLLPAPILVSAVQLASAPKGLLTLDVSSHNVELPAAGVFVVLEGLGSEPDQQFISITSGPRPLLVTGSDPKDPKTYQVGRLDDYSQLAAAESADQARTWLLGSNGRGWRLRQGKPGKPAKNVLVTAVVSAD